MSILLILDVNTLAVRVIDQSQAGSGSTSESSSRFIVVEKRSANRSARAVMAISAVKDCNFSSPADRVVHLTGKG